MDTKPSKENGLDKPSSQSPGSIAPRFRLARTLLFAGLFALLAMLFVPMRHYAPDPFPLPGFGSGGGGGYRLFFVADDIAVTQLLVNVAFAALAGAILANLSKRALYRVLYVIGACIAVVVVGVGVFALKRSMENASKRAGQDESFADDLLKKPDYSKFDRVKMGEDHLHAAAKNWRLALRFDKAKRVEKRADEVAKMSAADRERINQGVTPDVSPSPTPVEGFDPEAFIKGEPQPHGSPVEAADLRKIILFDVTYNKVEDDKLGFVPDPFSSNPSKVELPRIKGRLRNELPRKISHLKLTILFFNSDGKLIETQPVEIYGVFYPGGPTSFSGEMPRVLNLPEGWTWKVTVSNASYTKDEN